MTAMLLRFPIHPVRVTRGGEQLWLVIWRGWIWTHPTHAAALADAYVIATAHRARVIDDTERCA
jgi:hypothetical protein